MVSADDQPNRMRARPARRFRPRWSSVALGGTALALLVFAALLADFIAPHDPNAQSLTARLLPPLSPGHILGTDPLGRDVLSRLLYGARVSLIVGTIAVVIGGSVGTLLGLLSGYYGGWIDDIVSWWVNVQLAFPFILLVLAVVAVVGPNLRNLVVVLGLGSWVVYARVLRGQVLSIREREFVIASRVVGATDRRLIWRHVLPNAMLPLIVIASFEFARMIILEASLSFLGLGVEPSVPSWGSMLAEGRSYLDVSWWVATIPGLAIMLTVLSVNLVGDWLRDEFDPRSKVLAPS